MTSELSEEKKRVVDRERTNILRYLEQPTLVFLCRWMPRFVTPDMLTVIGMLGTGLVLLGFLLARDNKFFLLLSIFGFAINWFGDSLDGRIAYYRNIPRKWYGFALDSVMDWLSLVLMSIGYFFYIEENYRILVFTFSCAYAWSVLMAHIKYKITDVYVIDAGLMGPTETRVIICLVLLLEVFFEGSIRTFSIVVNVILISISLVDTFKLVKIGDQKDKEIKRLKEEKEQQQKIQEEQPLLQ